MDNKELSAVQQNVMFEAQKEEENLRRELSNEQPSQVQEQPLNVENTQRDLAVQEIEEKLRLQTEFGIQYKDMDFATAKVFKDSKSDLNGMIRVHEVEEESLKEEKKKFELENDEEFAVQEHQEMAQKIFLGYYAKEYTAINKKIQNSKEEREKKQKYIQDNDKSIEDKIKEYKQNCVNGLEKRKEEVNRQFAERKDISSKNKKEKSRKKGYEEIKDKVVGATMESAAMVKDMQHRQKLLDKWKNKPPKITEKDVALNVKDFDYVFKNKSGSAIQIKAIMEKISKLEISLHNEKKPLSTEEKEKYTKRLDVLKKTYRVVCAANGIDSETNDYFKCDNEQQKQEIEKKIQYANAVYETAINEYKEAVQEIETPVNQEEHQTNEKVFFEEIPYEELNKQSIEKREEEKEYSSYLVFTGAVESIRKKAVHPISNTTWDAALAFCNSYDNAKYKDESGFESRKSDLVRDVKFLEKIAAGDISMITEFAEKVIQDNKTKQGETQSEEMRRQKQNAVNLLFGTVADTLEQLKAKGITLDNAYDTAKILKNPEEYTMLANSYKALYKVSTELLTEAELHELLQKERLGSELEGFKLIAQIGAMGDYSGYIERVKASEKADERTKKRLSHEGNRTREILECVKNTFSEKYNEKNISNATLEGLSKYEKTEKMLWLEKEAEPMYTDSINQLQEYIDGLEENLTKQNKEFEIVKRVSEISKIAKRYMVDRLLLNTAEKSREKKNPELLKVEQTRKEENKNQEVDADFQEKFNTVKKQFYKKYCYQRQLALLNEVIDGKDSLSMEEIQQRINTVVELRSREETAWRKTRIVDALTTYQDKLAQIINIQDAEYVKTAINETKKQMLIAISEYVDVYQKMLDRIEKEGADEEGENDKELEQLVNEEKSLDYTATDEEAAEITNAYENYMNMRKAYLQMTNPTWDASQWDEKKERAIWKDLWMDVRNHGLANHDFAKLWNNVEKYQNALSKKLEKGWKDESSQKIDAAKNDFYTNLAKSNERSQKNIEDAAKEINTFMEGLTAEQYNYVINNLDEELLEGYLGNDLSLYKTDQEIKQSLENSQADFVTQIEALIKDFNEEDYKDIQSVEAYKQLAEIIKNGGEITDEVKMKCIHSLGYNEEVYNQFKKDNQKLKDTIAEAKKVLEEEKDESGKKYDDEEAKDAYKKYQELVNRNFTRTAKSSIWGKLKDLGVEKAKSYIGVKTEEKKKLGEFGSETDFIAYTQKYEQLVKEKGDKFHGITMNSLSVQNFLLDDSDDKYIEAYYNLATKKGYKSKDKYLISKSDFAISKTKDGYTDVNFEALMFKRNELKKWLDENKNLAPKEEKLTAMQKFWDDMRSPKQRRYDRRMERFELLNKYLKLYSEANGVDFVTGELFCEMGMSEEEVSKKVENAAMLLVETQSAIFESFNAPEVEFDELSEAKEKEEEEEEEKKWFEKIKDFVTEGFEKEKELLENYKREEVAELTALYSKIWSGELTGLEYEKVKRTAHTIAQIQAQIGKLEGACKISAGFGKMKNALTEKEFYTCGVQIDAQVSVTALSMEMMAEYQTKFLGMKAGAHAKANIDVCKAEAKGCAKCLLLDSEGKLNPSLHVDLAAELALLKMEVNAGIEGLGVGLDANLSFMVGLAARFNVGIKDWKVTVDMAAALGIGAGIQIELDFSELKDMIADKAMQLGVKAEHFVAGKMASWGIARNSEIVQKFFEDEISKLDATMDEILSIYDDKTEQKTNPNPVTT